MTPTEVFQLHLSIITHATLLGAVLGLLLRTFSPRR